MAIRRARPWALRFLFAGLVFAIFGNVSVVNAVTLAWNANPEPDIAGYKLFWGEVNGPASARDVGKTTQAEVTDLTAGRTFYFYLTAYNTAALESEPSATVTYTAPSGPPPIGVNTEATYVRTDAATSGSWRGAYGLEGAVAAAGHAIAPYPNYVQVSAYQNYGLTWANSTTDARGLQKASGTDRFATAWHSTNSVYFFFNFTDTAVHQVGFYFLDFDRQGRRQVVEFYDDDTGEFLGTETISSFENGRYSIWNLRGNVRMKITRLAGPNCVLSGMFFDAQPTALATYVGTDTTTAGSWRGSYGTEGALATPWGYLIPPSYVQISAYQNNSQTWSASTTDTRALQKPSGTDRFAGAWNHASAFYFYLKFKDAAMHEVSFYFVDYDRTGRQQKLEIFDQGTGNLLASRVISNFGNGVYHSYNLSGNIRVKVSRIAGPNCVMSAMFFDATESGAEFIEADTVTSGTWKGTYGADGQAIATQASSLPAFATVTFSGASLLTWSASTTDTTALQKQTQTDRVASAWSGPRQYTTMIALSDGEAHSLSLYFVDFDNKARKQLVEVIDVATGAALDHSELTDFRSGVWLTYNVRGNVMVRITSLTDASAVMSGIFMD
jgi:hypothetical protein